MEAKHFSSFEEAIFTLMGNDTCVTRKEYVGGGDINEAYKLTLSNGSHLFMKSNAGKKESFFEAEALGNISASCDGCMAGIVEMYQDYIDGKKEIRDINMEFRAGYISGDEEVNRQGNCPLY